MGLKNGMVHYSLLTIDKTGTRELFSPFYLFLPVFTVNFMEELTPDDTFRFCSRRFSLIMLAYTNRFFGLCIGDQGFENRTRTKSDPYRHNGRSTICGKRLVYGSLDTKFRVSSLLLCVVVRCLSMWDGNWYSYV